MKTNRQKEIECWLNWKQNYLDRQAAGRKIDPKKIAAVDAQIMYLLQPGGRP